MLNDKAGIQHLLRETLANWSIKMLVVPRLKPDCLQHFSPIYAKFGGLALTLSPSLTLDVPRTHAVIRQFGELTAPTRVCKRSTV